MNTPPRNDAAPAATGAGVNGPNTSSDSTFARLPLMPPVRNAGAVVASGRKRKARSNCPATVWVLSEFAPKPERGAA